MAETVTCWCLKEDEAFARDCEEKTPRRCSERWGQAAGLRGVARPPPEAWAFKVVRLENKACVYGVDAWVIVLTFLSS